MVVLPELPMQLILHILQLLPPNAQTYSAKLVNKAGHASMKASQLDPASQDLPVWVLQQYLPVRSAEDKLACCGRSKLLNYRASVGDLQGVMFLRNHGASWDSRTTAAAAGTGQLEVLLYLRAQNPPCEWDITTCTAAAAGGPQEVLQWCRSQQPPAPWGDATAAAAAAAGHLAILQWLLKPDPALRDITNNSHNSNNTYDSVLQPKKSSSRAITSTVVVKAGQTGQTCEVIEQTPLQPQGSKVKGGVQGVHVSSAQLEACPWSPWMRCAVAARAGQLHILKWLLADGSQRDAGVCAAAAAGGHLHVLTWLRTQSSPCQIDSEAWFEAASNGHVHILQYLQQHTPARDWDEALCLAAAIGGHLEVMKWVRSFEPPCPWVPGTTAAAANSGNSELVVWLKAQGAP